MTKNKLNWIAEEHREQQKRAELLKKLIKEQAIDNFTADHINNFGNLHRKNRT